MAREATSIIAALCRRSDMTVLFALLSLMPAQDTADDLKKEVEKLRVQVRELQERLGQLEDAAVRDAQLIQRLRTAVKTLETNGTPREPNLPREPGSPEGPKQVLKGRVIHVDSKFNFVLIDL